MTNQPSFDQRAESQWQARHEVQRQLAAERQPPREHSAPGWETLRARSRIVEAFNHLGIELKRDLYARYCAAIEEGISPLDAHNDALGGWLRSHQVGADPWWYEAAALMLMRMAHRNTPDIPLVLSSVDTQPGGIGNIMANPPSSWVEGGVETFAARLLDGIHPIRIQDLSTPGGNASSVLDDFRPREETVDSAFTRIIAEIGGRLRPLLERIAAEDRAVTASDIPIKKYRRVLLPGDANSHAEWLVRFQFLGNTYRDIAKDADVEAKSVSRAIHAEADLAEFSLKSPPKGGRPKGSVDKAMRWRRPEN